MFSRTGKRYECYINNRILHKWILTNIASRIFFLMSSIFCFFSLKEKNITVSTNIRMYETHSLRIMKWKFRDFSNSFNARETTISPKMACTVLSILSPSRRLHIAIKNARESLNQERHFVRLSFHQAVYLSTTGAVLSLKNVTNNFLSTSLAYETSKWNGCLDIMRVCEPKENISSTLFKYGE